MANYRRGSRIQSVTNFRVLYFDQSRSIRYQDATREICDRANVTPAELARFVHAFVNAAPPPERNLRDLVAVMQRINRAYNLDLDQNNNTLYEVVKGLPSFSNGRLGYTFNRRRRNEDRGVFLFSL